MDLDHVFCFVDPAMREVSMLGDAGFVARFGRGHPRQGTSNRSVLFEENYLELIFLRSRNEAEANVLRLDRRADWRSSGHCPFGICLRGVIPDRDRESFWAYQPDYGPAGWCIWIHRSSEDHPELPLLFVVEPSEVVPLASFRPLAWAGELTEHACGAKRLTRVLLNLPHEAVWPLHEPHDEIVFEQGDAYHMVVEVDGRPFAPLELNPILELRPSSG